MIEVDNVIFSYPRQGYSKTVDPGGKPLIHIPQLKIASGESVFIKGDSGSGKSTLLNLLAGIFLPQQGKISIGDVAINHLSSRERDVFRAQHLGVIFQQFNLIPYLSVVENAELPLRFLSPTFLAEQARPDTRQLLEHLQIPSGLHHASVNRLSAGQQQRVAIARALIGGQEIIIADEPTSALDETNQRIFMDLLFEQTAKKTLILVSHDTRLSTWFSRVVSWEAINHA